MTFDLSILEIFPCWSKGGCLCTVPKGSIMAPAKFIRDKALTVWISVPSVGLFMTKMRLMKPNAFPSLRYCLFCGEPLLATSAANWQAAAPNAIVENTYGPTEATVAITHFRWDSEKSQSRVKNGFVPIGWPFRDQMTCLVDPDLSLVSKGRQGELCLSGTQVTSGYFNNAAKTLSQFVRIPSLGDRVWYRTGDIVTEDEDGCMHYVGRVDNQVKILGYRVELQEIDFTLRKYSGTELLVAIPVTNREGHAESIVAFICGGNNDKARILDQCRQSLPKYMVPRDILFIDEMPLNHNGKIDRSALMRILNGDRR